MGGLDTQINALGPCLFKSPLPVDATAFIPDDARVRYAVELAVGPGQRQDIFFEKAGARHQLYFDPAKTRAAIVTCGGICPGLNNVIRSLVMELYQLYGVRHILGIRYGYSGLNAQTGQPPIVLTPENVEHIHNSGGTILGSSRGAQPSQAVVDFLEKEKINILFCVGGDGTLRGAENIAQELAKRHLPVSVIGIPKTIDNDVMYTDRTFGLVTALEVSRTVVTAARDEARSAYNGVGLVKLMGRDAGFVAAGSVLASQDVDFCLVPEIPIELEGPRGFLQALEQKLKHRHHAVVVVAEGAGQGLIRNLPSDSDASGNKRYADIGAHLKEQINAHFKKNALPVDVKYFDPSYLIRSVPANVNDAILCDQLARAAVHAAMAGKTSAVIGFLNGTFTHVPICLAISQKKQLETTGPIWQSVLAATGQPSRWS